MKLSTRVILVSVGSLICTIYLLTSHLPNSGNDMLDIMQNEPLELGFEIQQEPELRTPKVIILTYQRCGSSFIGNLFGQNPDAFYVYEPLDSLYTAMYGTAEGWNVPSDITSYINGTVRTPPNQEVLAVGRFLENLLSCKLEELPVEFFSHKYWKVFQGFQAGLAKYKSCLIDQKIRNICKSYLREECPTRFGLEPEKQRVCRDALWLAENASSIVPPSLRKYKMCAQKLFNTITTTCLSTLKEFCLQSKVRTTKTVRGTVEAVAPLLRKFPDLRIISLVRDPRAVALSRMKMYSTRGLYSGDDFVKEAELYCRRAAREHELLKDLNGKYPQQILFVIYEDFVKHPIVHTERIYDFIGIPLPNVTRSYMGNRTRTKQRDWKRRISHKNVTRINTVCSHFFQVMDWKLRVAL